MPPPITPADVPSEELKLLEQARLGDSDAFATLATRYERKIYRIAKNIVQSDEDAEDVVQDALLKAFEHLPNFQGQSKFYTWLVRITVNEALMKLRKRKSDRIVSLDDDIETDEEPIVREIAVWGEDPESKYTQTELRAILDDAIQSALTGGKSPKDALTGAQQQAERVLKDYR